MEHSIPYAVKLVSIWLEIDKHIIAKCQAQCGVCDGPVDWWWCCWGALLSSQALNWQSETQTPCGCGHQAQILTHTIKNGTWFRQGRRKNKPCRNLTVKALGLNEYCLVHLARVRPHGCSFGIQRPNLANFLIILLLNVKLVWLDVLEETVLLKRKQQSNEELLEIKNGPSQHVKLAMGDLINQQLNI